MPAWERLARRIQKGDLQDWMRGVDELRHEVTGKLLLLLPWSPMQDLDLASVPTDGAEHELTMYMEDTMWPIEGKYPDYVEASGTVYAKSIEHEADPANPPFIRIEAGFQPAFGSHVRREVTLMQRILDQERLLGLLHPRDRRPRCARRARGCTTRSQLRDQWESKLLRTSSWSPLH